MRDVLSRIFFTQFMYDSTHPLAPINELIQQQSTLVKEQLPKLINSIIERADIPLDSIDPVAHSIPNENLTNDFLSPISISTADIELLFQTLQNAKVMIVNTPLYIQEAFREIIEWNNKQKPVKQVNTIVMNEPQTLYSRTQQEKDSIDSANASESTSNIHDMTTKVLLQLPYLNHIDLQSNLSFEEWLRVMLLRTSQHFLQHQEPQSLVHHSILTMILKQHESLDQSLIQHIELVVKKFQQEIRSAMEQQKSLLCELDGLHQQLSLYSREKDNIFQAIQWRLIRPFLVPLPVQTFVIINILCNTF